MALAASGLRTYQWNNHVKSVVLLALFPVLLLGLTFAGLVAFEGLLVERPIADSLAVALARVPAAAPFALAGAGAWFAVAFVSHNAMIRASTGARLVGREEGGRAYDLLENLCISRGLSTPKFAIMETEALNAYASGLTKGQETVAVTRGLLDTLDEQALEAVLAHELTHIRNRDVQMMMIAIVFVGIFSFLGEVLFRGMTRVHVGRADTHRRSGGGNAAILLLIALAVFLVSYALAVLVRFALSRRREYLADAGAVELTKDRDAMIRALETISGRAEIPGAPDDVRELFLENDPLGFSSLFATHPPIEKRIAALRAYA